MLISRDGEEARKTALKALELDPNVAEAHVVLGAIEGSVLDWDWSKQEKEFQRALELNPDSIDACACYANFLIQMHQYPEALQFSERAVRTNPLSGAIHFNYGDALFNTGQIEAAVPELKKAIELDVPLGYSALAHLYERTGKPEEAIRILDRPEFRVSTDMGLAYAYAGRRADALKLVKLLVKPGEVPDGVGLALVYFALGDKEQGFRWLTLAFDEKQIKIRYMDDPVFDDVRNEPRFKALVARLKIPN